MPCEEPLRAYATADGSRVKFFKRTDKQYWDPNYTGLHVPCGNCILCREEQARQWAIRITHEATLHDQNSFITLTYDEAHTPEHNSLNYRDLTLFWKRLRKEVGTLKYYAVGEYGDTTLRPHYHACIFGHAFTADQIILKETPHRLWTSMQLQKAWGLGLVSVGALTFETARYTASYVTKKLRNKQQYVRIDEDTGELIALEQPRPFMSRNLAKEWWQQWNQGVTDHDRVVINAKPQKPPRAYDKWLSEINKPAIEKIKEKRITKAQAKAQSQEQRHARALLARARTKQKAKSV